MGHGLHDYSRRHGGNKMKIEFTDGLRRPKNPLHAAKLSSEVGIQIRDKVHLATNWTRYKKDETLKDVILGAICKVAVSPNSTILLHSYVTCLPI
jgi:hypothetical protein